MYVRDGRPQPRLSTEEPERRPPSERSECRPATGGSKRRPATEEGQRVLTEWFVRVVGTDPVMQGLAGGTVIAAMNTLGAALVVVWPDPSERALDGALGFAAGVMLSASFTSLILPGIEIGGIGPVLVGVALGVRLLDRADQWVPHDHVVITGRNGRAATAAGGAPVDATETVEATADAATADETTAGETRTDRDVRIEEDTATGRERLDADDARTASVLLFIVVITLHNMPEGLAVGVAVMLYLDIALG